MERKNTQYVVAIVALVIAVVGMSVAFAFSSINLTITGNATTESTKWDVHFNTIVSETGTPSNVITTAAAISGNTTVSYAVDLQQPGDKYELVVEVKNFGNFDAKLTGITLTSTDSIAYLTHSVKYGSTTYTNATNEVTGTTLAPGATEKFYITVSYDEPANDSDLPSEKVSTPLSVTLTYAQDTD